MIELAAAAIAAAVAVATNAMPPINEADAWILASMAAGETGLLFGGIGEAERWIMWTAINRVTSDRFPNDLWTVVEQGFYGHRRGLEPTSEMLALATEVLSVPPRDDPTGGCLYVMSGDDMVVHDWDPDSAVRVIQASRWGLFFFREMPRQ